MFWMHCVKRKSFHIKDIKKKEEFTDKATRVTIKRTNKALNDTWDVCRIHTAPFLAVLQYWRVINKHSWWAVSESRAAWFWSRLFWFLICVSVAGCECGFGLWRGVVEGFQMLGFLLSRVTQSVVCARREGRGGGKPSHAVIFKYRSTLQGEISLGWAVCVCVCEGVTAMSVWTL